METYHGQVLLTSEQVERVYRVTDLLDLHRDWVVVPLMAADPPVELVMVDGKVLIRPPSGDRFEPWLAGLGERLRSLDLSRVPRRAENDPKWTLTGPGVPRPHGTLRYLPESTWPGAA